MEETLFPHMNSVGDAAGIEEERRLAYVAITRARKRLYLTCAYARQIFGQTSSNPVSRFIQEIPSELRQTTGEGSAGFSGIGLGEARQPTRASRARHGGRRRARVSALERLGLGGRADAAARPRGRQLRAPRRGEEGRRQDDLCEGRARWTHKTIRRGTVIKVDGDTLHIKFAKNGQTKKLLKDYAPIVKIAGRASAADGGEATAWKGDDPGRRGTRQGVAVRYPKAERSTS